MERLIPKKNFYPFVTLEEIKAKQGADQKGSLELDRALEIYQSPVQHGDLLTFKRKRIFTW